VCRVDLRNPNLMTYYITVRPKLVRPSQCAWSTSLSWCEAAIVLTFPPLRCQILILLVPKNTMIHASVMMHRLSSRSHRTLQTGWCKPCNPLQCHPLSALRLNKNLSSIVERGLRRLWPIFPNTLHPTLSCPVACIGSQITGLRRNG
jgi:hypothetical protein